MNLELLESIRRGGYLPPMEKPSDVYWRLSRAIPYGKKLPQSTVGLHYLDNVFSHRFEAKTQGSVSFHDAFNSDLHLGKAIQYVLASGRDPDKDVVLRNLHFNVRTPAHFYPESAAALCKHLAPGGSIFDAFTGWGGRSLGAICSGASRLVSVDLQQKSADSGIRLSEDMKPHSLTQCSFICADFASVMKNSSREFDLILASPPFLDTEDYGVGSPRTMREWVSRIAVPLSVCSKNILKPDGFVAVHGQDKENVPVLSIIHAAFEASGYHLHGEFQYGKKSGQSVMVWRL